MHITTHSNNILGEDVRLGRCDLLLLAVDATRRHDRVHLFRPVEIGDVARVQDIIDVLQERLHDDLRVREDEGRRRILHARL